MSRRAGGSTFEWISGKWRAKELTRRRAGGSGNGGGSTAKRRVQRVSRKEARMVVLRSEARVISTSLSRCQRLAACSISAPAVAGSIKEGVPPPKKMLVTRRPGVRAA